MGCDIHTYREKFVAGKWLPADEYDAEGIVWDKQAFHDRNYNLFGLLAGVRKRDLETSLAPRGLPFDVSPEVQKEYESWDADGHSHSYLYLHELKALRAWVSERNIPVSGMKRKDEVAALKASIASGKPDWDLLYPYCQGTNDREQIEFSVEMPMSYMIGGCLDKIIAAFDGIEGENHRLVFWFDN